jgi:hypothetical protein
VIDDPYTLDLRLCDDDGMVSEEAIPETCLDYLLQINNLRAHSGFAPAEEPFVCTGHAHLAGEHIRCTSPAHQKFHCLRCDRDVPASEVHEHEWTPGRIGTFHSCGDYAHPAWGTAGQVTR